MVRYKRAEGVEEAPLSGEVMLFDPSNGRFFVLNQTMAFIWSRCEEGCDLESLLADVGGAFQGVDESKARGDLQRALDELKGLGLVQDAEAQVASGMGRETRG